MRSISVKLPDSLAERLDVLVRRRSRSRSSVVRQVLEAHLEETEQGGASKGSCLDLARDLAGSVAGATDLSHARRHLKGYGS